MDCKDIPRGDIFNKYPEFLSDGQDLVMRNIDSGAITMSDLNRCVVIYQFLKNRAGRWCMRFLEDIQKEVGLRSDLLFVRMIKRVPKGHYNVMMCSEKPKTIYIHHCPILNKLDIGKEVSVLTVGFAGFLDHSAKPLVNTFILKELPETHLLLLDKSSRRDSFKPCMKCDASDRPTKRCSGCNFAHYCGKECQRADWKSHKKLCNSVRVSKG